MGGYSIETKLYSNGVGLHVYEVYLQKQCFAHAQISSTLLATLKDSNKRYHMLIVWNTSLNIDEEME